MPKHPNKSNKADDNKKRMQKKHALLKQKKAQAQKKKAKSKSQPRMKPR